VLTQRQQDEPAAETRAPNAQDPRSPETSAKPEDPTPADLHALLAPTFHAPHISCLELPILRVDHRFRHWQQKSTMKFYDGSYLHSNHNVAALRARPANEAVGLLAAREPL